jgi:undecaprenyl-diphosphatase
VRRLHATAVAAVAVVVVPLAVLVRARWSPLIDGDRGADRDAHTAVVDHRWLVDASRLLTHLGDPTVVTVLAILVAAALWFRSRRTAAAYVLLVRLAAVVVGWVLKTAVGRSRPVLAHPVAHAHGFSFPSGHALGSAALYGSVAVVLGRRLSRTVAVAVAALPPVVVAATRVLLGVHYPSDVVAGLVLGWACALLLTVVAEPA